MYKNRLVNTVSQDRNGRANYLLFARYNRANLQKCHFLQNATKKIKFSSKRKG
jgi:hypothetical protein